MDRRQQRQPVSVTEQTVAPTGWVKIDGGQPVGDQPVMGKPVAAAKKRRHRVKPAERGPIVKLLLANASNNGNGPLTYLQVEATLRLATNGAVTQQRCQSVVKHVERLANDDLDSDATDLAARYEYLCDVKTDDAHGRAAQIAANVARHKDKCRKLLQQIESLVPFPRKSRANKDIAEAFGE